MYRVLNSLNKILLLVYCQITSLAYFPGSRGPSLEYNPVAVSGPRALAFHATFCQNECFFSLHSCLHARSHPARGEWNSTATFETLTDKQTNIRNDNSGSSSYRVNFFLSFLFSRHPVTYLCAKKEKYVLAPSLDYRLAVVEVDVPRIDRVPHWLCSCNCRRILQV